MIYILKGDYFDCKQWIATVPNLTKFTVFVKEKKRKKSSNDVETPEAEAEPEAEQEPETTEAEPETDITTTEETAKTKTNQSFDDTWESALEACRASLFSLEGFFRGSSSETVILFHSNQLPEIPLQRIGNSKKGRPLLNYFSNLDKDLIIWLDTNNDSASLGNFDTYIKKSFKLQDIDLGYPGKIDPTFSREYLDKNFNCFTDIEGCKQNQVQLINMPGITNGMFDYLKSRISGFNSPEFSPYETCWGNPHGASKKEKGPAKYLPKDGRGFYLNSNIPYNISKQDLENTITLLTNCHTNPNPSLERIKDILPEAVNKNLFERVVKFLFQKRYREAQAKLRLVLSQLDKPTALAIISKYVRDLGLCWLLRDTTLENVQHILGTKYPKSAKHFEMIIKNLTITGEYFYADNTPVERDKVNNSKKPKIINPDDKHVRRMIIRAYQANINQDIAFLFSDIT